MKKKVLFISYAFPPALNPESIQSSRYVKYLSYNNWQSDVVCADYQTLISKPFDFNLLNSLPSEVTVYPLKPLGPSIVNHFLSYDLFRYPDGKIGWYIPAVKKSLSLIKENDFDVIHSWAMEHISNFVGLKLKKETGLPWISHFSDPWVDNPYHFYGPLSRYFNLKWEKEVMENSDMIVFVSEETKKLVLKKYPDKIQEKCVVIPHCFDVEIISQLPRATKPEKTKFTLTYTGNFYLSRSPRGLFISLKNLLSKRPELENHLNIQIVGKLPNHYKRLVKQFQIEKIVTITGTVPYLESLQYLKNADVLLVIDAPSKTPSVFLPLKLIEYLGFKKPILGITPLVGESASLIRSLRGCVVSPDDIHGIENAILSLYEKFKENGLSGFSYGDKEIEPYNAYNTSKRLAECFENVCS
jgi:glycosyltransferase involved in cell wall biosynthesis